MQTISRFTWYEEMEGKASISTKRRIKLSP